MEVSKLTAETPRRGGDPSRIPYVLAAAVLFGISTWFAGTQKPRPDAFERPSIFQWSWWRYPLERNAPRRLQTIRCDLNAVFALDRENVWAVGNAGMIVFSADGGYRWSKIAPTAAAPVPATTARSFAPWVAFAAEPPKNEKAQYQVQQKTLPRPLSTLTEDLVGASFEGDGRSWVKTRSGSVFYRKDSSGPWMPEPGYVIPTQLVPTKWSVGRNGLILFQNNRQVSGTTSDLNGVDFLSDGKTGWVVGADGTILLTEDSGQHWFHQTRGRRAAEFDSGETYAVSFPPWYYLTWLVWTLPLIPALIRQKERPQVRQSVADLFVSDRPLEKGDPDPLNLNAVANGLARFLRNRNTRPPLTVAITGEWGTGKSSLMNLVRTDLAEAGFRPVWFNAWHHQKEEHLLAALLQNIRLQAIPDWWSFDGIRFFARLQWFRGRRKLGPLSIWLLAAGFSFGLWWSQHGNASWLEFLNHARNLHFEALTVLAAGLASAWSLSKRVMAFGVNPASLMASLSSSPRQRDLEAQASFRQKFAQDFSEVTRAMGDRSMVIFVDDLDRCRPEHVLEVLEAINFLVTSGECFVVLGMARGKVEKYVGLGFKEIAQEMASGPEGDGKGHRAEFARHYLDKLINIEVPVPEVRESQARGVLVQNAGKRARPPQRTLREETALWARRLLPVSVVASLLALAFHTGTRVGLVEKTLTPKTEPAASVQTQGGAGPSQPAAAANSSQLAELLPPDPTPVPLPDLSVTLLLLAAAITIQFKMWEARHASQIVEDSPEFIDALDRWHPMIFAKCETPRAIKRFLNRVRYMAMRQAGNDGEPVIPEAALVELAARQLSDPSLSDGTIQVAAGHRKLFLEMTRGAAAGM